eukprot:scaffold54619_cov63-Phaeocystis_antarctica.AAC.5
MWAWRIGRPHPQLVHGDERGTVRCLARPESSLPRHKAKGPQQPLMPAEGGDRCPHEPRRRGLDRCGHRAREGSQRPVVAAVAAVGSLTRPESSLQGTGQRVQPNASMPREGAPKSSRRHVGLSLGSGVSSSSSGLRRRGPLRGARGGGPSAGCMKRRFGGERLLLPTVAATIAMTDAGAFAIAAETVA